MDSKRKIVFLVDDDMTNLTVGKKAISNSYDVFTLNSGILLLEMLDNLIPDIILLDINMPEMDGYETLDRLKSNKRTENIPVIFLTSLADEDMELKGLAQGAIDYITKPFSPPLLSKRIEIHLLMEDQKQELQRFNENLSHMVEEKTQAVVALKDAILSTMAELVEYRDDSTGGHIARTRLYIKEFIFAMKMNNVYLSEICSYNETLILQSCQLHDVGKIAIPDAILGKPGKLTAEEFDEIKKHTSYGEKIIHDLQKKTIDNDFVEYARIFAVSHHEKWDGTGYPQGLKGTEIPLLGRIMAIVDVYDALVSARPYKEPFPHTKAAEIIISGKGVSFDPILIDLFEGIHHIFEAIAAELNSDGLSSRTHVTDKCCETETLK